MIVFSLRIKDLFIKFILSYELELEEENKNYKFDLKNHKVSFSSYPGIF